MTNKLLTRLGLAAMLVLVAAFGLSAGASAASAAGKKTAVANIGQMIHIGPRAEQGSTCDITMLVGRMNLRQIEALRDGVVCFPENVQRSINKETGGKRPLIAIGPHLGYLDVRGNDAPLAGTIFRNLTTGDVQYEFSGAKPTKDEIQALESIRGRILPETVKTYIANTGLTVRK